MPYLTPEELRCLDRSNGRRTDDAFYIGTCRGVIEKLISEGYLAIGTNAQSLPHADISVIRKLLKDKGLKAGGKKTDLVHRVFQNYTDEEIESADIPKSFALTSIGEQVVQENSALLRYFNSSLSSRGVLEPEEIIDAQAANPNKDALDILINLLSEKVNCQKNTCKKRMYTFALSTLYFLKNDETRVRQLEEEIRKLDEMWEKEREEEARKLDDFLGITYEDRQRIRQELVDKANSDTMSEEEFFNFVDSLCGQLSEEMSRKELRRIAEKLRTEYKDDSVLSLREEIELTFNSMLRAEQYHKVP